MSTSFEDYPATPLSRAVAAEWEAEADSMGRHDLGFYLQEFARDNPATAALWCFGLGVIVGWKLKPW